MSYTDGKGLYGPFADALETFCAVLHEEQRAFIAERYKSLDAAHEARISVHVGKKYVRVDVGTSGKYMIDLGPGEATRRIYGIKAYGVPHKGHVYGTLDTIAAWCWGGYRAVKKAPAAREGAGA